MKNRVVQQLLLAMFWFFSAYTAVMALLPEEWAWRCAWLNLIIGMLGLLFVTRTRLGDRLFYEGPKGEESGSWRAGLLWAVPIVIFFLAIIWWLARLVGFYDW